MQRIARGQRGMEGFHRGSRHQWQPAQPGRLPGHDRSILAGDLQIACDKCPQAFMDGATHRIHRAAQAQSPDVAVLALAEGVPADVVEAMLQAPLQGKEAVPVIFLVRVVDQIDIGEGLGRRRCQQRAGQAEQQDGNVHLRTPREGASSLRFGACHPIGQTPGAL
ncbi:hypothetical protein G6F31_013754 [Rhizopus arrhizus]|nr:hypothetical protein G6F31_013754 [Rhizopus arrhizus]